MIHIITAENRHLFRHALMEMHRQRKAVFIDELGWRLNGETGIEIDAYDAEDVIYLIEADAPRSAVTGSARLLPTGRPHLLSEAFADLCDEPAPCGPEVWEATRFCPSPDTPRGAARQALLMRMIGAIMETALLFGIDKVTFVASAALSPLSERAGWDVRALGAAKRKGREKVRAYLATINAEGLKRVRERIGAAGPLTRFIPGALASAA
jgi:acyl-homoserine lactone synthase